MYAVDARQATAMSKHARNVYVNKGKPEIATGCESAE